jgi:hypothetical protein
MTATLWIHRSSAADILVRFPTALDAYSLGARFLFAHQSPVEEENFISSWNETSYTTDEMFHVGDTPSLQLSIHPGEFHPEDDAYLGVHEWSPEPILILTPEEALTLESTGTEPPWCHELEEVHTPPRENSVQESAFAEGTTRYGPILPGQLDAWSQDDESVDEDWRQTQIEMYRYGCDR